METSDPWHKKRTALRHVLYKSCSAVSLLSLSCHSLVAIYCRVLLQSALKHGERKMRTTLSTTVERFLSSRSITSTCRYSSSVCLLMMCTQQQTNGTIFKTFVGENTISQHRRHPRSSTAVVSKQRTITTTLLFSTSLLLLTWFPT